MRENVTSRKIIGAAIEVDQQIGPGLFKEQLPTLSVSRAQEQSRTIYEGFVMKG